MSEIRATTISDLAGTGPATLTGQYAAKAWVNFNGTGTVAIRASGNVSSLTDLSAGNYTVNFSNNFNAADYAFSGLMGVGAAGGNYYFLTVFNSAPAVGAFSVRVSDQTGGQADVAFNSSSFHGDLA